jgi:hypothetical protein
MKRLLFIFSTIVLLASCQPEISETRSATNQPQKNLQGFFTDNSVKGQRFTSNSSSTIQLTTAKGHKIILPPNAFVTLGGQPVTGEVAIEVKEINAPWEMILSDRPTMSNGRILESGGEFFIRATKNGQELKLAPGVLLRVDLPASSGNMQGMQVFNGQITPDSSINWVLNNNPGNMVMDSLGINPAMFADSMQWLNVDKFVNQPNITFTVNAGNTPDIDSTRIFLHLTGRNSVVRYSDYVVDKLIAAPATVIGISVKSGVLYTSVFPVNMQHGQSATLNFAPSTVAELEQKLKQLR